MRISISSFQNKRIKHVVKLRHRRHRDAGQETIVEGIREIQRAFAQNIVPTAAFICPEIVDDGDETAVLTAVLEKLAKTNGTQLFEVTAEIFAKIAYRGDSGGLLLIIPYWHLALTELPLSETPLFVVIENAEKPGNLGAILRTADAAGVDGVIVCGPPNGCGTDLFNPNVIRASLGAIFSVPVAMAFSNEVIHWLRAQNIQICAALPEGKLRYTAVNMTVPIAIVTGSESFGLTEIWSRQADFLAIIPMYGKVDSLNLSVSTALFIYEAVRQRHGLVKNEQHHLLLENTSNKDMP